MGQVWLGRQLKKTVQWFDYLKNIVHTFFLFIDKPKITRKCTKVSNDATSGNDSHPHGDVTSPPSGSLGKVFSLGIILWRMMT